MMLTHNESKIQAYELINSMKEEDLKNTIEIMQNIIKNNGIQLFRDKYHKLYADLPNTFLKIIQYDDDLGPKYINNLKSIPFNIPVTEIIDDYIINNAEKFNGIPNGYVLKTSSEVIVGLGYKVLFKNYIFYAYYCGSPTYLFVSKNDFNEYVKTCADDCDDDDDTYPPIQKVKYYVVSTQEVQVFILIENLDKEIKMYEKRSAFWIESANWD